MRIVILCSILLLSSCGLVSESQRVLTATADSVEELQDAMEETTNLIKDVRSGEFDWNGMIAGVLGGAVAGGGGGFLAGRKKNGS